MSGYLRTAYMIDLRNSPKKGHGIDGPNKFLPQHRTMLLLDLMPTLKIKTNIFISILNR